MTQEAKREAKKRAAEKDLGIADYFDELLLGGSTRKKGKGGFDNFF